jgi:small subunit ribosomal protein S20
MPGLYICDHYQLAKSACQCIRGANKTGLGPFWKFLGSTVRFLTAFPYLCRPKFLEHMANHKATQKDVRQAGKRRERNKYYGKTTRNAIRDLKALKENKEAGDVLPKVSSMIDKLAKKGIIHKNKAANIKRKLAKKVNALAK